MTHSEADLDVMAETEQQQQPAEQPAAPRRRSGAARRPRLQRMQHRPAARRNIYPDVLAWVEDWLAPTYAHEVGHGESWRWCPQWWAHAEALVRLEAAWRAWEVLRLDPGTGPSTWLLQHGDPCMRALADSAGPFSQCSDARHRAAPALPTTQPPPGLFSN